jgi:signal transduction histidine kinase
MFLGKLGNRLALHGVLLTWTVGGLVGFVGYRQMVAAVQREAVARVQDAVRVGQRVLANEFAGFDLEGPDPPQVRRWKLKAREAEPIGPIATLFRKARTEGRAEGFALLPDGLSLVVVRRAPGGDLRAAAMSLRGANRLPDLIRDVVFGADATAKGAATITLFEGDVRVATNVTLPDGRRAVGTRAAPDVARRVLGEGADWNDRAYVVDRWRISSYRPIHDADGVVIGMLYAGLDEAPYVAERERSMLFFALSILALMLAVSVEGWIAGRRLAKPLTLLTSAATALARGEREHIDVAKGDPEEVRALADSFNHMSEEIHTQTAALEESRKRAEKALADYIEILGFVSHELKSPIAGALTQLALIEDGSYGKAPEKFARPMAALRRSLAYGREIAQSFTQLSRAEGEGFSPSLRLLRDFSREVAALASDDLASEAAQRRMRVNIEGGPSSAWGDPDLLRVVLDNLIGYAVKYGEEGTDVLVTLRPIGAGLRVEVTNHGIGIAVDRFPELFEKFHRLQDPRLRSRKGTGVGLYLVKRIVELHGGTVGVEGEYGLWIRFWFELPPPPALAVEDSAENPRAEMAIEG